MGWFDEQIEFRKKHERELLSDSFENIARAITGRKNVTSIKEGEDVDDAVSGLLKHLGIKEKEVPPKLNSLEDKLDYLLSSTGVLYREIILDEGWHADAMGPMIGTLTADGSVIAILPAAYGGYEYVDPHTGRKVHVRKSAEKTIGKEALCFYRPFPMRKMKLKDIFHYMTECLSAYDIVSFGVAALAVMLVGMIMPKLNYILMGTVSELKSYQLLYAVITFFFFATVGKLLLTVIQSLLLSRIRLKLNNSVNAATMMRILSLPASFFKDYPAGELNQYISYMDSICGTIIDSVFSTGITGVFSLVYISQVFRYARSLVWPSLIVTLLTLAVSILSTLVQTQINKEKMVLVAKERGLVFSLITGIQKLRLSGAENRAFCKWSALYAQGAKLTYSPPAIIRLSKVVTSAISLAGAALMYYIAVKSGVSTAEYYAFNSAYAYISGAFSSIAAVALSAAAIKPSIDLIQPLFNAEPETAEGQETVTKLSGSIELSHITFGYDPESRPLFEDLSIQIPARQYVAIVGRSGCGKSTLMRLMLGFEKPARGAIYYDKKDLQKLDMRSVRRQIGTVLQDGKLFSGSIFENIVISAPMLKLQEAWDAAETAGIADDIRAMPMGMHTVLQEGGGTISGGQRQRLMIARAVAPKPKILMFDEATSALDNITQKKVSEALDRMRCTRIVIAHRLSTIKHCDRILVLDNGKIAEDGKYEELIAKNGIFAELVARQRLND